MKAAVYPGKGQPLVVESLPDPKPGPDDVILKVHRCGICGTDLHMTQGHAWDFPAGIVPGHEYAGEVVEIGANVTRLRKGDRITALPSTGCGRCEACRRGNLALCHDAPGVMGGFGELMRVPQSVAIKLPQTLSMADGALIEPLAVGLHGVGQAHMAPDARVLVLGAGSVALCAIYWARRLGAGRIVAMSRSPHRADMALAMGADAFIPYGEDERALAADALGGAPEIVFECVGAPGFLSRAVEHAAVYGQVISLGFCTEPDTLTPAMAGFKGVSLQFPVGYSLRDFEHVAAVMDKGHIDPAMLVTSVISINDLPATFDRLRSANTETKVQVRLTGSD